MKSGYELTATLVKAITGILGGSLVLQNEHPYLTLIVLSLGAVANEVLNYLKK